MAVNTRLILIVPQEDFRLIRQLILKAKTSFSPVHIAPTRKFPTGRRLLNWKYLDVIVLDRVTLATEILIRALPESLRNQNVHIYLTCDELPTIFTLLAKWASRSDDFGRKCRILFDKLTIVELLYKTQWPDESSFNNR